MQDKRGRYIIISALANTKVDLKGVHHVLTQVLGNVWRSSCELLELVAAAVAAVMTAVAAAAVAAAFQNQHWWWRSRCGGSAVAVGVAVQRRQR